MKIDLSVEAHRREDFFSAKPALHKAFFLNLTAAPAKAGGALRGRTGADGEGPHRRVVCHPKAECRPVRLVLRYGRPVAWPFFEAGGQNEFAEKNYVVVFPED